jgi:hypothetical protein
MLIFSPIVTAPERKMIFPSPITKSLFARVRIIFSFESRMSMRAIVVGVSENG